MDQITLLLKSQLTEREIIILLLVESGMGHRDLARRLGVSHYYIGITFTAAKAKMDKLAKAGLFSTAVEQKKD